MATAVGAVEELLSSDRDGILIRNATDAQIVTEMVRAIALLARDRSALARLAEGALATAAQRSWTNSLADFIAWSSAIVPAASGKGGAAAAGPARDRPRRRVTIIGRS
jgi:hypothetical protein